MSEKRQPRHVLGPKALEMIMSDVLDGMHDFAMMKCFESDAFDMEVISIEPAHTTHADPDIESPLATGAADPDRAGCEEWEDVVYLEEYRQRKAV